MSSTRPKIVGPDAGPEPPYPLHMEGKVISGFGRGSKELGIPTANLPVDETLTPWIASVKSGVYFGYASLALPAIHPDSGEAPPPPSSPAPSTSSPQQNQQPPPRVFPMVMSIGYNPFYGNAVRSAEVHVLHGFAADFYDAHMRLLILGFVREEQNYDSLEALVEDINTDCDVARASLAREAWTPAGGQGLVVVGGGGSGGGGGGVDGKLDASWLVKPL